MMTNKRVDPIQEIKDKINILEVISDYVELKPSGDRFVGFCPFHKNVNTPAFTVYPDQGRWVCYGCGKRGDLFTFLEGVEGETFKSILQKYATQLGIQLTHITKQMRKQMEYEERLYDLLMQATKYYQNQLNWNPQSKQARAYLKNRGIEISTIMDFGIGYAPDEWDDLTKHLKSQGFTFKELQDAGVTRKSGQKYYDFFRNRIMFPISFDDTTVGFAGRTLDEAEGTKYINSPKTRVFNKRQLLYGLPFARQDIWRTKEMIIVEGYMDVVALHQQGIHNSVSLMGSALTDEQATIVQRLTDRVVFALDPDDAGRKAVMRVRSEVRNNLDIYVATLPTGRDPDEIVLESLDNWKRTITSAKPIPIYITDVLVEESENINDPKEKRKIVNRVLEIIDNIKNPHEKAAYSEYLSKAVGYTDYIALLECPHCGKKLYETT